jgi:glycerol-3-phosphate dehydrogenase
MDCVGLPCDVAIFGGGAAGLWTLDVLVARGLRVVLLESDRLGGGQTVCAQGIIHGGVKYTLNGILSGSASAIRGMPEHWRDCLSGRREPHLTATRVRADHCYLWRTGSARSRLGMIGARIGLRAKPQPVPAGEQPESLASAQGVARIAEPVIDPVSLVNELGRRHHRCIMKIDATQGVVMDHDRGRVESITLSAPGGGGRCRIEPGTVVLTAGAGNAELAAMAGIGSTVPQQQRPLHMLMMRGRLPELNGHCVDGARTRVTITSDTDSAGRTVWQVGGQIAEDGVDMDGRTLIRHGAAEIRAVLPAVDLGGVEWGTYRIDRVEASQSGRPDDASVTAVNNVIVAWPTKLALVPRLASRVSELVTGPTQPGHASAAVAPDQWPRPGLAKPPWETHEQWSSDA